MKFTDGYWLMRPGVRAHYAAEVHQATATEKEIRVVVPTRSIRHRGDTLQGPLLNLRLSSPMADVIRVKISHFEGGAPALPTFPLASDAAYKVDAKVTEREVALTSGALTARIDRSGPWSLAFEAEGKVVTQSPSRGIGYIQDADDQPYVHEQLQLGVGELVYGLGERFTAFVKNGQSVEIWNRDGGTGSDQAYKNIPFYMTNRGYGVFVNHPGQVAFEVASEKVSRVQFSVPGEELEYFVIYGPTPKEVLQKYTALTGRPPLVPAWTFGLWLTTSFTTNYDEKTVTEFIQGMADRDLPLHVFHFDCFWMRAFHWCDFEWDPAVFPDPKGMLARLKERGLHVCVWINSYIGQESGLFEEGKAGGYLLKRPNGDVWQWDMWQPGMAIVDFTNPAACEWFAGKLKALVAMGVDAFKTDFGERIPTDVVYHDGADPVRMHNFYTYQYNKTVFDVLTETKGKGEAALFARSATAGCQQFPIHWGGDCYSDFPSMAESLRGGLSLGLSGFGFWSHDIGGFEGLPPVAVYKRWLAFGLFSSHSRLHGSTSYRVPWLYDDEACDVLRVFTKLKCRLMPYLFAKAVETSQTGVPMMRAMVLEFPEDPATHTLDRQYMLGDRLLFAPVFSEDGVVDFYLPSGVWVNHMTGEEIEGGGWRQRQYGVSEAALFVRPNTVLPMGALDSRPDYDYAHGTCFEVVGLEDGAEASAPIVNLQGRTVAAITVRRSGATVTCRLEGITVDATVLLVNRHGPATGKGCRCEETERGLRLAPDPGTSSFSATW